MKIISVADTHGDRTPLKIAKSKINDCDKVIFLGDYVDSYDSDWTVQEKVLSDILSFKKEYPDKVILLFGNHDFSYISDPNVSGHQHKYHCRINNFFIENFNFFDVIYKQDNWVFSHAGVSETWLSRNFDNKLDNINPYFHKREWGMMYCAFDHLSFNPYGDSPIEGPLWIRPAALNNSSISFNQCVGHTEFRENVNRVFDSEEHKLVFLDSEKRNVFAEIDTASNEVRICKG